MNNSREAKHKYYIKHIESDRNRSKKYYAKNKESLNFKKAELAAEKYVKTRLSRSHKSLKSIEYDTSSEEEKELKRQKWHDIYKYRRANKQYLCKRATEFALAYGKLEIPTMAILSYLIYWWSVKGQHIWTAIDVQILVIQCRLNKDIEYYKNIFIELKIIEFREIKSPEGVQLLSYRFKQSWIKNTKRVK